MPIFSSGNLYPPPASAIMYNLGGVFFFLIASTVPKRQKNMWEGGKEDAMNEVSRVFCG